MSHAGTSAHGTSAMRSARSDPDFRHVHMSVPREHAHSQLTVSRENPRLRSASEANLLHGGVRMNRRHSIAPIDPGYGVHEPRGSYFSHVSASAMYSGVCLVLIREETDV